MRTLIVGTSGQLATELRRAPSAPRLSLAPARKVDLTDPAQVEAWLDAESPNLVINAVAFTAVDRAETEPERAFAVNATGPLTLAQWCTRHRAVLVHISTDYVFDGQKTGAYLPDDATRPLCVYGASKLVGEQNVRSTLDHHLILRTSWVFSAHAQNFVKTMLRLAGERDELRVVADQVGRPTPAAELARAIWAACDGLGRPGEARWGTYHVAGAGSTCWHAFAEAIVEEQRRFTGRAPRVVPISTAEYPTPARRPASSILDTTSFETSFGIELRPWRDGLHKVVHDLLAR